MENLPLLFQLKGREGLLGAKDGSRETVVCMYCHLPRVDEGERSRVYEEVYRNICLDVVSFAYLVFLLSFHLSASD